MNTIPTNLLTRIMRAIKYGKLVGLLGLDSEISLSAFIGTLSDSDVPVSQIPGSGNLLSQIQALLSRVDSTNFVSYHLLIRIGQIVKDTPDVSIFDLMETAFYIGKLQAETEASDTYTKLSSLMYGKISESFTGFSADGHKPQPEEVRNQFNTVVQYGKVVRRLGIDISIALSLLKERLPTFPPIEWKPGAESYYPEMKAIGVTGERMHHPFLQLGYVVKCKPQPTYLNLMEIAFFVGQVEAEIWTTAASHIYTREIQRLYDGWELADVNSYVDINL